MRKTILLREAAIGETVELLVDGDLVPAIYISDGDVILKRIVDHFNLIANETITSNGFRITLGQRETENEELLSRIDRIKGDLDRVLAGIRRIAMGWRTTSNPTKSNASCLRACANSSYLSGLTYTKEGLNQLADALDDLEGTSNKCPACGHTKE